MPFLKRAMKWTGIGLGLVLVILLSSQILPPRDVVPGQNPWRPKPGHRPLIIAHGGGQGLQPPNTLEAFAHSVKLGCDALEMDLRLTKDGALVTLHDETIDRTSDGTGRAIDFTLAELKGKNFGYKFKDPAGTRPYRERPARLAALEELFVRFPTTPMIVELKDRGANGVNAAAALTRLIEQHRREASVIVAAFDDATLDEFRRSSRGRVFTAAPMERTRRFVICNKTLLDWFAPTADQALQIPVAASGFQLDTPRLIRAAHRRNVAVHYWTINDATEMKRLIELGADGIMTDRPDRLLEVLAAARR
jgi:glycerophosphoryl diester phosphodiesterase